MTDQHYWAQRIHHQTGVGTNRYSVRKAAARQMVLHVNDVLTDVKTNVTLKLDADLLREARVVAAEEGRFINGLLTDRLEAIVRERKAFDEALRRALARVRDGLDLRCSG